MNICPTCHTGRLQKRVMVYLEWLEQRWLIVNRMPAMACDICGERTYDRDALENLQRLLWSNPVPPPARTVSNRTGQERKAI